MEMTEQKLQDDPLGWMNTTDTKPPLNEGQQKAHDRIVQYVIGEGENLPTITLIRGYAGTGKTFTINRIVESLKAWSDKQTNWMKKLKIAASAPTHKAVRVMRKNAEFGHAVQYATIHSLLGLVMDHDPKTGQKIFVPSKNPEDGRLAEFNVLIIDEISMLGKDLWDAVMEAMVEYSLKIIVLGDPVQIPPVNELDCPAFLHPEEYGIEVLELTQSMRQAGDNPILDYATAIRGTYKHTFEEPEPYAKITDKKTGITLKRAMDAASIEEILGDLFGSDQFKSDADFMKVIAWTNKTVDQFNNKIRRMLYAVPEGMLGLPMLVHGEKLILDERYAVPGTMGKALATNEELEVVKYEIVRKAVTYKVWTPMGFAERTLNPQIYATTIRYALSTGKTDTAVIHIVHESSVGEVAAMLKSIKDSALKAPWQNNERKETFRHFYSIKGLFAEVKYNYAVTAHKAQGSTYTNCMLVHWDIKYNRKMEEMNRINYVGVTRARNMLYIVQ